MITIKLNFYVTLSEVEYKLETFVKRLHDISEKEKDLIIKNIQKKVDYKGLKEYIDKVEDSYMDIISYCPNTLISDIEVEYTDLLSITMKSESFVLGELEEILENLILPYYGNIDANKYIDVDIASLVIE